jgi:O-acetyl-ADP-ribose deacetylase (regulator of RNase III)
VVAHVVNDAGKWGQGVSGAIGRRWPVAEAEYRAWPGRALGRVLLSTPESGVTVAHICAQHGVRSRTNPVPLHTQSLRAGLFALAQVVLEGTVVVMPKLGCGLAGGTWPEVEPIIRDALGRLDVVVYTG